MALQGVTKILKALAETVGKKSPTAKELAVANYKANAIYDTSELLKALDPKLKTNSKKLLERTRDRAIIQGIIEPDSMGGVPRLEDINDIIKTVKFDRVGSGKDTKLDKNSTKFQKFASEFSQNLNLGGNSK